MKVMIISDNIELSKFTIDYLKKFKISFKMFHTKKNNELTKINSKYLDLKKIKIKNLEKEFKKIISIHCHKIIQKKIIEKFECINFHPGYNPYNRGMFPQVFSIINRKDCGATIHKMTSKIDQGPIIERKKIIINNYDTSYEVYRKIIKLQKILIKKNIIQIINNKHKYKIISNKGNYNSIKKFKKLCKLNLKSKKTLSEHIDLLRALSHKGYKNAYYIKNKKKIFVSLKINT